MKIKFNSILIMLLTVLTFSCTKKVLDINTNPNAPTASTLNAAVIIPGALTASGELYNNPTLRYGNEHFQFAGIWMGHFTYSGNYAIGVPDLDYKITNTFDGGLFDNIYIQNSNYNVAVQSAQASGDKFSEGIARLMKAYNFETLVDLYNNVPYSQALQGTNIITPVYDDAKTVYESINKEMDSAIARFTYANNAGLTLPTTVDVMFGGDPSKWLALANTMKLRLLLQQSARADRQSYIATEVAKISAGPFLTTDALINPGYQSVYGKWSPLYNSNYNSSGSFNQDYFVAAQYPITFLQNNNDPRLASFFNPASTPGGTYKGNIFGAVGIPNSQISSIGHGTPNSVIVGYTQGSVFMYAAESYFLQAEAALKGYISGNAQTLYQQGVTASFAYFGLSAAQASTYYSQAGNANTNWAVNTTPTSQLALIIRQKWVAEIWGNELIPYNDYRRLGLPADIPLSQNSSSAGAVPNRLLYPQTEQNANGKNVPAALSTDKIWWMN